MAVKNEAKNKLKIWEQSSVFRWYLHLLISRFIIKSTYTLKQMSKAKPIKKNTPL